MAANVTPTEFLYELQGADGDDGTSEGCQILRHPVTGKTDHRIYFRYSDNGHRPGCVDRQEIEVFGEILHGLRRRHLYLQPPVLPK